MPEPSVRAPVAAAPISVLLFAQAFSTETQDALQGWRKHLDTLGRAYEIFLIQETRSEVSPAIGDEQDARVFAYDHSLGFRGALNNAIHAAQYPLLAFCTCDKQYSPGDMQCLLKVIDQVDLVVGYRAGGQAPPWRVLLDMFIGPFSRFVLGVPLVPRKSWLGAEGWSRRVVARWIFGVRVVDPECPFRLARREIFQRLPIQSGGPFVQVEILAKANHLSCYLAEEPVSWTPPILTPSDAISFSQDARLVFHAPDFGRLTTPALSLETET